jgi:glycogen operon protein
MIQRANKAWHGVRLGEPDWGPSSHSLAFAVELEATRQLVHVLFNAYWEPLEFELPPEGWSRAGGWRRWIDTAQESPNDIVAWQTAPTVSERAYRAEARSVVVFFADLG